MGAPQAVRDAGLDAVIGMYPAVHRLRTTVVAPWTAHLLGDAAVRPPHRVLVHGAEGCGVTFIAERLVDELTSVAGVDAVLIPTLDEMARQLKMGARTLRRRHQRTRGRATAAPSPAVPVTVLVAGSR